MAKKIMLREGMPVATNTDSIASFERCDACRWWVPGERVCRRNAPVPLGISSLAIWPATECDDFCGEFCCRSNGPIATSSIG